ncbi:MAG: bifunctional aldolase/short-chain dehydrogenase [Planctomycetota bacterium]
MKSRWTEQGAREAIHEWAERYGEDFALRLYTARLIGEVPALVLHGGGNVSVKGTIKTLLGESAEALFVKGSGGDLATIEPSGLPALDLAHLRRLRTLSRLDDEAMVNEFRTHLFDASAPTPSIETLAHAFLPPRFIDHSHADAVLVLTNQPDGEALVREALGNAVSILPYVRPGFDLAKAIADLYEQNPKVEGIVLLQHGLITYGDDARTSYERHIALVDRCEKFIERRIARRTLTPSFSTRDEPAGLASIAAPILRGMIAVPTGDEDRPYARSILEWRASEGVLAIINSAEAKVLAETGPLTGDHLIRTKPWPLYVEKPSWSDPAALRAQLRDAVDGYRRRYESYLTAHGGTLQGLDPFPRVVWLPGAGLLCWGPTKRDARIAADIAEHTLMAKAQAHRIGAYESLSEEHLHHMEFRTLQRVKLDDPPSSPLAKGGQRGVLQGQVVAISGGAGAIGSAIAEVCAEAGAHVAMADLDERRLAAVVERVESRFGRRSAVGVVMDVTDETSVRRGFEQIARTFGGVDVVVPNAGVAHVAPIEDLSAADFRRVMEVNATGYLLFMREGVRLMKQQGLGGNIVVISSKNVFAPGKEFAAYSASKAAAHQLGRLAAIELAPDGIRVNMLTPDAVFGDERTPSGLWSEVAPRRAKTHDLKAEELPEYYRKRNLLQVRVLGRHVGNAVVFFASNSTPTTGAVLPIDGGLPEAFPR